MAAYHDLGASEELERNISWFSQEFILYPERLMSLSVPVALKWQGIQFSATNKDRISEKRGVYAFMVRHADSNLPPHGYITYIGITGNKSKTRNLRLRFNDYLSEQQRPKRRSIHKYSRKINPVFSTEVLKDVP